MNPSMRSTKNFSPSASMTADAGLSVYTKNSRRSAKVGCHSDRSSGSLNLTTHATYIGPLEDPNSDGKTQKLDSQADE